MNLMHLKYALEIARTGSLNKAAENLCMGQPNLSRAIKELEAGLGIVVFHRSAKGMVPTPQGDEFLRYAGKVLADMDEIENLFKCDRIQKQQFSISVPRAEYIAHAFARFSKTITEGQADLFYKETNAQRAIKNILEAGYDLGIIRYASIHDYYFKELLAEKGLHYEVVAELSYRLLMSREHPLADKQEVRFGDLTPYMEIAHGDPYVPTLPMSVVRKAELPDNIDRRIFVFERASQFELLSANPQTFMWVSPVSDQTLERYGLVQKASVDNQKKYKDVLIYRKEHKLSSLDNAFIAQLGYAKQQLIE